jgi:hypothetical protein
MNDAPPVALKAYCNHLALGKGLDPGGYGGSFATLALIETALPWKRDIYQQPGALPQRALDLLALWLQRYYQTGAYDQRAMMIAPDAAYSRPGHRRVLFYTRPPGEMIAFDKVEYCVPDAELGGLLWALHEAPDDLPHYAQWRTPEWDAGRDLLVCTHGTVDAACAKFGYPLYRHLRGRSSGSTRVWRVSHFGGHVFAPTLIDMPTGHYWAYVEPPQADAILTRTGDPAALRGHYRGWAGVKDGFAQAAERECWQQHGWAWLSYPRSGTVLSQDADPQHPAWAEVLIRHVPPDGEPGAARLRIEVSHTIETITTTGDDHTYAYPQYRMTQMETLS